MFSIICDYLIFFGFLIGSTLFPLWNKLPFRKKNTTDQKDTKANYVFATGQVGIFAMMFSIARGTLGVRAFLGELIIQIVLFCVNFKFSFCVVRSFSRGISYTLVIKDTYRIRELCIYCE